MDLFGTAGIRGDAATEVTPSLALSVGRAAAEDGSEFVVGRDGRETGAALAAALEAGLESGGADVSRVGRVPTPALSARSSSAVSNYRSVPKDVTAPSQPLRTRERMSDRWPSTRRSTTWASCASWSTGGDDRFDRTYGEGGFLWPVTPDDLEAPDADSVRGWEQVVSGSTTKPFLSTVPRTDEAEAVIFEWLEWLQSRAGFEGCLDALRYYRSIEWLTEDPGTRSSSPTSPRTGTRAMDDS